MNEKLTISLPKEAILRAKEESKKRGSTLSGYFRVLLERDFFRIDYDHKSIERGVMWS